MTAAAVAIGERSLATVATAVVTPASPWSAQVPGLLAEQRAWLRSVLGADVTDLQPAAVAEYADAMEYYRFPLGAFVVAHVRGRVVGCVAVRRTDARSAELKRLYVREAARGRGVGRRLVAAGVEAAGRLGVRSLWLQTKLPEMAAAERLYRDLGFVDVSEAPIAAGAVRGLTTLELDLRHARAALAG